MTARRSATPKGAPSLLARRITWLTRHVEYVTIEAKDDEVLGGIFVVQLGDADRNDPGFSGETVEEAVRAALTNMHDVYAGRAKSAGALLKEDDDA